MALFMHLLTIFKDSIACVHIESREKGVNQYQPKKGEWNQTHYVSAGISRDWQALWGCGILAGIVSFVYLISAG